MDESTTPLLVQTPEEMSIPDILIDWTKKEPNRTLLETTTDGSVWTPISAAQMHERVNAIAKGLIASGVEPGDRVGLMARTSADWTIVDFAIWYAGAVTVPVYETSSPDQTAWILSDSAAKAVVVEHSDHRDVVEQARAQVEGVEHVWTMTDRGLEKLIEAGRDVPDEDVQKRYDALRTSDLATIIYTSGTTGRPKGAELTHGNFVELTRNAIARLGEQILHDGSRTLLFMPLAHVFGRFVQVLCVAAGAPAGHTADTTTLMRDIAGFKPTFILSVPRVFEKVYNASEQKAAAGGKEKIFRWAARVAEEYSKAMDGDKIPTGLRLRHRVAHKLVLSKIQQALGGQAEFAISGSSPLGHRLAHFFRGVGLTVLEGYGLTETTAPV